MAKEFHCSSAGPIVQIRPGKLRGYQYDGLYIFKGIKYADAKRWQEPVPTAPWEGIKDALAYGYISTQFNPVTHSGDFQVPHRAWPEDENCQYLNVWTPSLDSGAKKPVMVWIHGGGFAAGSSVEMIAYEGESLAKYGDLVLVSLNHRLNILGHLDVSLFGEEYRNSGNAGLSDIVMALKWVRENIASFGGDPDNVTIFGQSGGGRKIRALLQSPAADGLYHKAVIQSGICGVHTRPTAEESRAIVLDAMKEMGLSETEFASFAAAPIDDVIRAYKKVGALYREKGINALDWLPQTNDWYLGDMREVGVAPYAKTVPTMIGTVFAENQRFHIDCKNQLPLVQRQGILKEKYGDNAQKLMELFEKAYPQKNIIDLLSLDNVRRSSTLRYLDIRSGSGQAPIYSYLFALDFPFNDGTPAWHCAELPYVFRNTDSIPVCNWPGVSEKLEETVSSAWIKFAHTGCPGWDPYLPGKETTMIFDRESGPRINFDRELIRLHRSVDPQTRAFERYI